MLDEEKSTADQMVCRAEENYEQKYGINKYDLFSGSRFDNWNETFTFLYSREEGNVTTDYIANNLGWILISSRFKVAMERINEIKNVQYLPVAIKEISTNEVMNGFYVLNIIGFSNALDLENSVYKVLQSRGKKMLSIIKFALNETELDNLHILRLEQHKFSTFISEALKSELNKNFIKGCDFLEIKVV